MKSSFLKNSIYLFLLTFFANNNIHAQTTIFEDDFESYSLGEDLTNKGYKITSKTGYAGNITATISDETGNKMVSLNADVSGQAIMQFQKTITVVPGVPYVLEVITKGNFKRKLQVLSTSNSVIKSTPDFTPTEVEKTQWIKQQLSFTPTAGLTSVTINIFHNWSGTLKIDQLKVVKSSSTGPYYLSSLEGNDSNDGSKNAPWKTLSKISETVLSPGDKIYLKKGNRFDGHFIVNGSGSETAPILITSYGNGIKPIITGEVGASEGGDYQEAILVQNNDNIIFDDLEIQNERLASRAGVDDTDAFGILIKNNGTEILRNFTFKNLTFKNVYAPQPILPGDGENAFNGLEVAAVRIITTKNKVYGKEKNIQNVLMEDCYFTDLQRLGVHIKHGGGSTGVGDDAMNRNMNLVFRRNTFEYIGGTCILPTNTYNCLIEDNIFNHPGDNSDPRMPNRGSAVWTWRCHNTVIQNNQCLHIRGYLDSHGIHIDHENVNTFVQYNYMEDCEGGFVEILGGNVNSVYRFNISVNDGWRNNPNWKNSNHTLWINQNASGNKTHYCEESYIYNNTIVSNTAYTTAIDMNAKNTYVFNNIFYAINGSNIGGKQVSVNNQGTDLFMKNNLFFGTIAANFKNMDTNIRTGNPFFHNEGSGDKYGYQLKTNSPAINSGVAKQGPPIPGAGTGIFENISEYPTVDFYGNPLNATTESPNIGACNAKNGEIIGNDDDNDGILNDIDNCPNTPAGKKVNELGCFITSPTNFSIQILSETCPNNNNGQILISTEEPHSYTLTINEKTYDFFNTLTISKLSPGTYDFCIYINGIPSFKQCFSVEIKAVATLSAKATKTAVNKTSIQITTGTAPFTVFINKVPLFTSNNTTFELNTAYNDFVEIKSSRLCEGSFTKVIGSENGLKISPNPTKNTLNIQGLKTATFVQIINMTGQVLINEFATTELDISVLKNGVYFLKTAGKKAITFIKNE